MRRTMVFLIFILLICSALNADPWQKNMAFDFKLTQATYSKSWTGGDAGNVAYVSTLNGIFEKQFSPRYNNRTNLKLAFGQTLTQDPETKDWSKPRKSTDQIDIDNLSRLTFNGYVDPYFSVRLESQFLDASVDSIKRYFNPLVFTEAIGVSRTFYKKEKDQLISRVGLALKERVLKQIIDTATEETDWNTEIDGGFESVTDIIYTISDNLNYVGKLTLFKAVYNSDKDEVKDTPAEDYWKAIDVNWENAVTAKVAKYVSVSLYMQFLYDKQITKKGRVKETLGLGLTYQLF
jgi:hypothetical protein